jgi:hypothetical protein
MLVRIRKGSLFALFSPKLWTVLNQYGAGRPCVMGLREWPPDIEFENLSFDRHAVLGDVGTIISCRLGAEDAPYFVREFVDRFEQIDLMQLPNYRIYLKLMIDG